MKKILSKFIIPILFSLLVFNFSYGNNVEYTGEFTYSNTLMQHQSAGMPFEFKINYLSQTYYNGPLGNNFDFNYNQKLIANIDGNIYYHNGKLGVFKFVKTGTGFYDNTTLQASLTKNAGIYTIEINSSKTLTFNTDLRLETIVDNFGNTLSLEYNEDLQAIKIIDSNSREYILSYYPHSRLKDITDFNSNKVEFVYFGTGELDGSEYDLKTIKTINGLSEKEISFTYTKGDTFEESHNIIKLIDSENNIYVENTYDSDDRVASQKYGNSSIYYSYTTDVDNKIIENSVTDREGVNTIFSYNSLGNVIKKVIKKISGDIEYNYEYTASGYISKEIYPLGNGFTYKYDSNNNLIEKRQKSDINSVDSNDDIVTSYEYNQEFNKITKITLANGTIINFTLDINGNITRKEILNIVDLDNQVQTIVENYEYNNKGELEKIIDANGNQTSFEYLSGSLVKSIKGISLNIIEVNYNYDTKGNIISITDGEGNITNLSYDDFNLVNSLTTPEGIQSEYVFNRLNKKTNQKIILSSTEEVNSTFSYDILDNPTNIVTDIDSVRTKTIVTQYDENSRITQIQSGNSAIVEFKYDEVGNIVEKKILSTPNQITSYEYDNNNRLVKQINPNLSETSFTYDLFDRIVKQTLQTGTYTTLNYDKVGNVIETKTYNNTNTLLQKQANSFDGLSRNIQTTAFLLENNTEIISKRYYDNVGNIVKIIDPKNNETIYSYDSFNRLKTITDTLGNTITNSYNKNDKLVERKIVGTNQKTITTSYSYDTDNRLTSETNELNETISYGYNKLNQVISKVDKDLVVTSYEYDYNGNLIEEIIDPTGKSKTTKYEYDIDGNLTKVIDSNNNETIYIYDNLNRLIKQTYPDLTFLTNEYDVNNNLIKRTDPNGTVIINNYDELNRLTGRVINTATGVLGAISESYSYDELGRLVSGSDSYNSPQEGAIVSFEYDSLNRLTSETNSNKVVNYSYDNNNNITSINNRNYAYDTANRLTSVMNGTNVVADYSYDSLTQTNQILGNGVTTNYSYDELLRLSSLLTENQTETIDSFDYSYNAKGNITSNGKETYSYDTLDQISQVAYSQSRGKYDFFKEKFNYDATGNRTTKEITNAVAKQLTDEEILSGLYEDDVLLEETYSINNLNQYTNLDTLNDKGKDENIVFDYDNNGNLKQDNDFKYYYDYKNRLVKTTKLNDEIVVEYKYDILGRRITKATPEKIISYVYAGNNAIEESITKQDTGEITKRENVYSNNLDDILLTIVTNPDLTIKQLYYTKNHLNSTIAITDETGNILEEYIYDVFGKAYIRDGNSTNHREFKKSSLGVTRLYTGREYDEEINLYYLRARYYNPKTGRFINRDPIDIADDVNLYGYVGNGVVMFVDLMGREKTLIVGFIGKEGSNLGGEITNYNNPSGIVEIIKSLDKNIYDSKIYKSDHFGNSIKDSRKFIRENKNNYDKLYIIGHSLGGDNAVVLSDVLRLDMIGVDLLITVDIFSFYQDDKITPNVKKAINFYQTVDKTKILGGEILHGEKIEPSIFNSTYDIINTEVNSYNGTGVNHTNIDNLLSDHISNIINNNK